MDNLTELQASIKRLSEKYRELLSQMDALKELDAKLETLIKEGESDEQ